MQELERITNEFAGMKLCDMSAGQLNIFLSAIAERGATNALERIGLQDDYAGKDVQDLRTLIKSWRIVRMAALAQFWKILKNVLTILFIIGICSIFFSNKHIDQVIKLMGEG